jgi:hypothetical protein
MKATLMALATFLVATFPLNPAKAQSPDQYQAMPAGFNYPGAAPGPVEGAPAAGCDTCGGGKKAWWDKLTFKKGGCGCEGGKKSWFKKGGCDGKGGCGGGPIKSWLCQPLPSNAPVLWKSEYPLGFPTHPYVRSPRDYFMWNDP